MHADGRHRRSCFSAIDVVDKNHRVALVSGAFAARSNAGSTAYAALRIDEHRLFHNYLPPSPGLFHPRPFLVSLNDAPLRCLPSMGNCLE